MTTHLGEAESFRELARRERARSAPWFDFVELVYRGGEGRGAIETRLAFNIPLVVRTRQASRAYESLAAAEEAEGEADVAVLRRDAERALAKIEHYESRLEDFRALVRHADQAAAIAQRAEEANATNPEALSELYTEIFQSRSLVLAARREASLAECDLLMATGLTVREWPRD